MTSRSRYVWLFPAAITLAVVGLWEPATAFHVFFTSEDPAITLAPGVPQGSRVRAIISSGEEIENFRFQGLPDGVGLMPGRDRHTVDVFVAHEETTVPFFGSADFQDASVSRLTLSTKGPLSGGVLKSQVALPPTAGFLRFCSAFMAGPEERFRRYTFFVNEESNDIVDVPPGAPYGPDPAIAPQRQGGYAVVLDAMSGDFTQVAGLGRLNHENTIVVPGGWRDKITVLTTDDTFNRPSAQLYMYLAGNESDIWNDRGDLWAFRVTEANGTSVDPANPFNDANDYLDLQPGDDFKGEFISVPRDVALGETSEPPQDALENWSNDNNIFQFIRLEDLAYDKKNPRIVYVADTGGSEIKPDASSGRMMRDRGSDGDADNGRIFRFVFNRHDPRRVDSFSVLADGDADPSDPTYVPMTSPDNIGTSKKSLMVQEDTGDAKVWRYKFSNRRWSVVATVNDPRGESSGIVDASKSFGPGWWMLTVQGHGSRVLEEVDSEGVTRKLESGQLLLMKIPGS